MGTLFAPCVDSTGHPTPLRQAVLGMEGKVTPALGPAGKTGPNSPCPVTGALWTPKVTGSHPHLRTSGVGRQRAACRTQPGTHTSIGSPWLPDLKSAYCLIKTFNKIFFKEHKSERERQMMMMMMKVQTRKFHLEQGGKNVCVQERKTPFIVSKNQFHFSFKIHPTRNVENLSLGCLSGLGSWAPPPHTCPSHPWPFRQGCPRVTLLKPVSSPLCDSKRFRPQPKKMSFDSGKPHSQACAE